MLTALTGCGQKGPLLLPGESAPPGSPAPAAEDDDEDEDAERRDGE